MKTHWTNNNKKVVMVVVVVVVVMVVVVDIVVVVVLVDTVKHWGGCKSLNFPDNLWTIKFTSNVKKMITCQRKMHWH